MSTQAIDIPEYVDTKTPAVKWYGYNVAILVATVGMIAIASLILEYEIAKARNPLAMFYVTPVVADYVLSIAIIALGFVNLTVLLFVFMRHLWLRKWMLATTILGWMLVAGLVLVLNWRFLPILFPFYVNPMPL